MAMANNSSESSTTLLTPDKAVQSSNTVIGAVLGTAVGLLVLFVLILVLSLVWCVRKANHDKQAYNVRQPIERGQITDSAVMAEIPQHYMDIQDTNTVVEMKTNAAYISSPTAFQISTEENVAYTSTKTGCDCDQVDYDYVL